MYACLLLADVCPWVTWILVIIGWIWVSKSHSKRETRKEIRAQIDAIADMVTNLEDAAHTYFMTNANDAIANQLSIQIKRNLKRLSRHVQRVGVALNDDAIPEVVKLRQSITLVDFDDPNRRTYTHTDSRVEEISESAHTLISKVEQSYRKRYQGTLSGAFP